MSDYITRQLSYHIDGDEIIIGQDELLAMSKNIVILGEAGIGKSRLLQQLAGEDAEFILARRLVRASDPRTVMGNAKYALIDAVDEVPSYKHGDAIDHLIGQLDEAGRPNFILSCRAEDWREATAKSIVEAVYGEPPIEMYLRPFDRDQILGFLKLSLDVKSAQKAFNDYNARGFATWLGNPQTLSMLAYVMSNNDPPESTADLFDQYVDIAWAEVNEVRREQGDETTKNTVLDTLGAAFAAVIMSGADGFSKKGARQTDSFLSHAELAQLPGFAGWAAIEGTRLLARSGNGGFTYVHRRVGEWLAARWLSRHASDERVRDRLLDSLVVQEIVPASLRGMFAWLARDTKFTEQVINADPMAVIEYGDADVLSEREGATLLEALSRLAERDPWFVGFGSFNARSLVRGAIRAQTYAMLLDSQNQPRLRLLIAEQFRDQVLLPHEIEGLRTIASDHSEIFDLRVLAAEALAANLNGSEWQTLVREVVERGGIIDARLAAEFVLVAGFDHFDNDQIAEIAMAAGGFGKNGQLEEDQHVGSLWRFRHELPDARLEAFLDVLANLAMARLPEYRSIESIEIINLGDGLIARVLSGSIVEPTRLLHWLEAFGGRDSYVDDAEKCIAAFIESRDEIRRTMQRHWLAGAKTAQQIREKAFRLERVHPSLTFSDSDLADYLSTLPHTFPEWKEIAWLVPHSAEQGQLTREALRRFTTNTAEYESWLHQALNPSKPDWEVEQEEHAAKRKTDRETRWADFRAGLTSEKMALTQGRYGVLLQAAYVYAGQYNDLRDMASAEERLDVLLGRELTEAMRLGLEAWLANLPQWPHSEMIAEDYSNNRAWNVRYILLSALAERLKLTHTLDCIDDDQLISAQLHITNHTFSGDEWQELRDETWNRLRQRPNLLEQYARLACEPSLRKGKEFVSGLHQIVHQASKDQPSLVSALSKEWLQKHWRMHWRAELELVDLLLANNEFGFLRRLVPNRLKMKSIADERRLNWQAIGLIVDFAKYAASSASTLVRDPGLFWAIRERLGARRPYNEMSIETPISFSGWLVEHARVLFPVASRPNKVTMGDTNPWDATEAISRMIGSIGSDKSPQAGEILEGLASVEDGYRDRILSVLAEHRQSRAEMAWTPIQPESLAHILTNDIPDSMLDLRSEVFRILRKAQALITSNDTDCWRNFYKSDLKTPKDEEDCSDALVDVLRQLNSEISFTREKHLGNDREGDIACEIGGLHLPIEVKGQWHRELWRAADSQLEAQQAIDHKAGGLGIYLVLWFGQKVATTMLKGPPNGSGIKRPNTPSELEVGLKLTSKAASADRIWIKVLDLSRG